MAAAPERLISSPALGRTEKEYQIAGGSVEAVGEKDLVRRESGQFSSYLPNG